MERIYSELLNNSYAKKFIDYVKTRITNQAPLEHDWMLNPEGIRVAFASTNTLGKSLTHGKDSISKDKAGKLVYKLSS